MPSLGFGDDPALDTVLVASMPAVRDTTPLNLWQHTTSGRTRDITLRWIDKKGEGRERARLVRHDGLT